MISDVLFDAIRDIEEYEKKFPHIYGQMKNQIAQVKQAMRELERELDRMPTDEEIRGGERKE
jgi:hypothetical protein